MWSRDAVVWTHIVCFALRQPRVWRSYILLYTPRLDGIIFRSRCVISWLSCLFCCGVVLGQAMIVHSAPKKGTERRRGGGGGQKGHWAPAFFVFPGLGALFGRGKHFKSAPGVVVFFGPGMGPKRAPSSGVFFGRAKSSTNP